MLTAIDHDENDSDGRRTNMEKKNYENGNLSN